LRSLKANEGTSGDRAGIDNRARTAGANVSTLMLACFASGLVFLSLSLAMGIWVAAKL
jgi:hypothetical protein